MTDNPAKRRTRRAATLAMLANPAAAQTWQARNITIIVHLAPERDGHNGPAVRGPAVAGSANR